MHIRLGVAALILAITSASHAQTFPSKPLRIIVPFAAGGAADLTSRMLGEHLSKALGQSVVVDNRPGAGAVIGYELGAKAPPDGHTMLIVFPSFVINPSIRRVQYDPVKDFRAVTQVSSLPMTVAAHPSLPANTMKDFVALARARPGEISYGTLRRARRDASGRRHAAQHGPRARAEAAGDPGQVQSAGPDAGAEHAGAARLVAPGGKQPLLEGRQGRQHPR
jgi:tripartite-type tricarboxylate transporter receptor subunit TctC